MQELLVVNPSKRPSKRRRKAASPAQKAARAKFAAMARSRAGKKRTTRRKRKSTSLSIMSNPSPRRHHKRKATRRRNPSARSGSIIRKPMGIIMPALMGALGATAVNTIMAKLPVPASLNTGKMKYLTQGAAAIALGAIASKLGVKGATAAQMAEGALTVTLHQAITDIAGGMGMNLSGMGYYLPGRGVQAVPSASGNPARLAGGMGQYITGPGAPTNVTAMPRAKSGMRGFGFGR